MSLPLFLNIPESMLRMRVITTKDRSESILKTLHEVGILHIEHSEELKPLERTAIDEARDKVNESLKYINEIISYIPEKEKVLLKEDIRAKYLRSFEEIESDVRSLYAKLSDLYNKAADLSKKIEGLKRDVYYLRPLAKQINLDLADLSFSGKYLFTRVFVLPIELQQDFLNRIQSYLLKSIVATTENEAIVYVIAKVDNQKAIETTAGELGCQILDIVSQDLTLEHFLGIVEAEIHGLEKELAEITHELQVKTKGHQEEAILLREVLSAESERLSILDKAAEAKYVTIFEGWGPEASAEPAIMKLKEDNDYVFVDIRTPTESEEPPTKLSNLTGLRPFEIVVGLFGIPKYREWDPTPLIAYSFAIFFGLMLGDVIYALGLIVAANYVLPWFVDDPESDTFKLFKRLIYTSSVIGLIIGLLTGTYLGDFFTGGVIGSENTDLALVSSVEKYLMDPIWFIVISLGIGLIHVNLGHTLGLIGAVKEDNKPDALSRIGILVLEVCIIPIVLADLLEVEDWSLDSTVSSILLIGMMASVLMIVIAAFWRMKALGAIFWLFDITGILGDVMSYCRLAGVGLATFYLASSFNMMADLIRDEMSSNALLSVLGIIVSICILIFAHLLNLALSGLAAFIHSLRLCFVEFMFKFYEGGGRQYTPFTLKPRTFVVVR